MPLNRSRSLLTLGPSRSSQSTKKNLYDPIVVREIKGLLLDKHPAAQVPPADILLPETEPEAQSVIFEAITAEIIEKAAHNVSGSGGPTHIDSDGWKQILCSKQYGKLRENGIFSA